jgi:hypothetical protein
MSHQEHKVRLLSESGQIVEGVWVYDDELEDCRLCLRYLDKEIAITEVDYFEAMCRIREELEKKEFLPQCYGASKNVFPSGMSRSMGDGLQAHRHRLGSKGTMSDLVSIFATGEDVEAVTVAEQGRFHEEWLESISNP